MLSQTRPNHTRPYQTKPTVKFLCYSPNKLDLNEIFAVAVDGYCLRPEQTKPYQIQLNYYASIKLQKWNRINNRKNVKKYSYIKYFSIPLSILRFQSWLRVHQVLHLFDDRVILIAQNSSTDPIQYIENLLFLKISF